MKPTNSCIAKSTQIISLSWTGCENCQYLSDHKIHRSCHTGFTISMTCCVLTIYFYFAGYDGGGGNTEECLSDATGLHIVVSKLHCFISVLICAASWRALSES